MFSHTIPRIRSCLRDSPDGTEMAPNSEITTQTLVHARSSIDDESSQEGVHE